MGGELLSGNVTLCHRKINKVNTDERNENDV